MLICVAAQFLKMQNFRIPLSTSLLAGNPVRRGESPASAAAFSVRFLNPNSLSVCLNV